jgi:hypothetical protein
MKRLPGAIQIPVLLCAAAAFSQTGAKPAEKIVFVRPDPVITIRSSMKHDSADPIGGAIHSVDDPGMDFRAASDAKMNLLATMNLDGSSITDLHINGYDPSVSPDGSRIAFCSLRNDI